MRGGQGSWQSPSLLAAFAAHCVAVAAETGAAAGGLGCGPGQARGTAAPEGRVCQHRAHGPGPSLPGARPGPAGAARGAPRGKPPAHVAVDTPRDSSLHRSWQPRLPGRVPLPAGAVGLERPNAPAGFNARSPGQLVSLADLRQEICCWG